MRKNLQKVVGTHFGKPIWLISMMKPPKTAKTTNICNDEGTELGVHTSRYNKKGMHVKNRRIKE